MRRGSARGSIRAVACAMAAAIVIIAAPAPRAHKAITSKYTYNEHIFPIVRDRCARCHFEGGPAPMSLLTYTAAQPWAESMREQLISRAMPPWYADPLAPALKGGHAITARELDTLITWAVGGAPEGASKAPAPVPVIQQPAWRLGRPDAVFDIPAQVVKAGSLEGDADFVIPGFATERWISAIDVLPGTPSMLRAGTIAADEGRILAAWVPGDDVIPAPSGTAFRLAPGEKLRVRLHYRKHWQDELVERSDRSSVGMYFGEPPVTGRGIDALSVATDGKDATGGPGGRRTLTTPIRVLGVTPALDRDYASVSVDALLPTGRRVRILGLQAPRPGWSRRYWLVEPAELPAKTQIEIHATLPDSSPETPQEAAGRFRVTLDVLPL
jgi:hypothetical protein